MKTNQKLDQLKTKISIGGNFENTLPFYAFIYSSLNEAGQKQVREELSAIGKALDKLQKGN